jgi:hypothetical protein
MIRLTLRGMVEHPVTVVEDYCTNCGAKKSRAKDNFCGLCGNKFTSVQSF